MGGEGGGGEPGVEVVRVVVMRQALRVVVVRKARFGGTVVVEFESCSCDYI